MKRVKKVAVSRRETVGLLLGALACGVHAFDHSSVKTVSNLAIGNYGMKSLRVEDSLREIAAIGFDGFELCAIPGWDSSPEQMDLARRKSVRQLLNDSGLRLVAVMEDLPPKLDDSEQQQADTRLRAALSLARDLSPEQCPLVQTVLGGGNWDDVRNLFRDRVGAWGTLAEEVDGVIGIKPHRFGAMSTPEQAAWIIDQLGHTPRLRIVYDYSHYAYRNISIEQSVKQSAGLIGYVALKDAVQSGTTVTFALPGESGQINQSDVIRGLREGGYQGDYCCEVSGQISSKPGYDPIAAAATCYRNLQKHFQTPPPK